MTKISSMIYWLSIIQQSLSLEKGFVNGKKMILIRRLCSNRYSIFCKKEIDGFIWNFKSIWRDWVIHICYGAHAQSSSPRISFFQCLCWISHYVFYQLFVNQGKNKSTYFILDMPIRNCQYMLQIWNIGMSVSAT